MKKGTFSNMLCAILWLLQLVAEGWLFYSLWKLDMVPERYLLLLAAVLLIAVFLNGVLMFAGRRRTVGKKIRRVFACILAVAVIVLCFVGNGLIGDLRDTLQSITTPNTSGVAVLVYVRADDPAATIQDAADYRFAAVEGYDEERTGQVKAAIEQELGKQIPVTYYANALVMADALYSSEVDAIILNGAYESLLEETEGYSDFSEKTKVLHTVITVEPTEPTVPTESTAPGSTEQTQPTIPEADITNTPFVLYISGSDTRYDTLRTSRSDVNILVVVNPNTKQVLLVNTPRDYYIPNPAGNGALDKLTHCGIYGIDCSIKALSDLYDIPVDYYAQINFTGFETLIDAVGGITVYSDEAFEARDYWIEKGENFMDGAKALAYARQRKGVTGGDSGRGKNQMKVITALIQKMTSSTTLITNYSDILESLQGMFKTDLAMTDMSKLVKMQLDDMATWEVFSYATAGSYGHEIPYSMPGQTASIVYMWNASINHGTDLMDRILAGEILTQEDMQMTF